MSGGAPASRARRPPPLAAATVALLVAGCSAQRTDEPLLFAELVPRDGTRQYRSAAIELTAERGFDALGLDGPASVRGAPELPDLASGDRRFAFVRSGCRRDSARLTVSDRTVDVELSRDGSDSPTACASPTWYLAVFDVPADDLPDGVLVG